MTTEPEVFTAAQVAALVQAKAKELGSVAIAAKAWKVSPQMVHMVIKNTRKPSPRMLKDLELVENPEVVTYRRKGTKAPK